MLQTVGYIWYFIVYVILLPFFILMLSKGLDYLVFDQLLGLNVKEIVVSSGLFIAYELFALVMFSLGVLLFLEATITLYAKTNGFPFSTIQHKHLQPKTLATSGIYGKIRHPMLLGYLVILISLGLVEFSPMMIFWWVPLLGACFVEYYKLTEEKKLLNWFGDEYMQYRKQVPALIPRFRKKGMS